MANPKTSNAKKVLERRRKGQLWKLSARHEGQAMKRRDTSWIMEATLWPKLFRLVCQYCADTQSRGGLDIEGVYSHKKCHMEACR